MLMVLSRSRLVDLAQPRMDRRLRLFEESSLLRRVYYSSFIEQRGSMMLYATTLPEKWQNAGESGANNEIKAKRVDRKVLSVFRRFGLAFLPIVRKELDQGILRSN